MKEAKFFRKQAEKAERLAQETADEEAALSLSNLAKAYRSQADVLRKNKKHLPIGVMSGLGALDCG